MDNFFYKDIYKVLNFNGIEFENVSENFVSIDKAFGKKLIKVEYNALNEISKKAFEDINFFFQKSHLKKLSTILKDDKASQNDKFVARKLLQNAIIASSSVFPICQDTGTSTIIGEKGNSIITDYDEKEALSRGIAQTYTKKSLRYSQLIPSSLYDETNSKTNLPAQIDLYSGKGDKYKFLFSAKGGGSSNKTFFFTENKSVLNDKNLFELLKTGIRKIGTAACPPYHVGIVVGGTSPEMNLKTLKLATSGALDYLKNQDGSFIAFRDKEMEDKISSFTEEIGMGAQYGGKYFALDNRIIRLTRHGASVFVSIGVGCYAHRNQYGYISENGIFLEKLEKNPAQYLPDEDINFEEPVKIDLNQPMEKICAALSKLKIKTPVLLNGEIIVARDIAHAKIKKIIDNGGNMPDYFKNHPVYYAGPAKIPEGFPSGSFGPTTSARMDSYVLEFQKLMGSMIMIGKGNRSDIVRESCMKNKGFYLGAIGGTAAIVGKESIKKVEVVDFEELGMEAVFKITVHNFPAFLITDDKGNDFFDSFL